MYARPPTLDCRTIGNHRWRCCSLLLPTDRHGPGRHDRQSFVTRRPACKRDKGRGDESAVRLVGVPTRTSSSSAVRALCDAVVTQAQ
jgi:hypothetical protein